MIALFRLTDAVHRITLWCGTIFIASRAVLAADTGSTETPVVDPFFMLSGALLTDGFDGQELDATLWSRPQWLVENHKAIGVKVDDGHLLISGPSSPTGQSHQYAGVISKYFRDTDVVLAADIQARTAMKGDGRIQHMVHLCSGDYPDFFTEIIFGKIANDEAPRWHSAYVAKLWEYAGHGKYLQPTVDADKTEQSKWHTVVLVHDGTTSKAQNYLAINDKWVPVGPSHSVRFNHTHIELKVDVNVPDVQVGMAVDNVRLYPNPTHNPATIVVYSGVSGGKPKSPIHNQKVQILEADSERLLGEALTDEGGEARVSLRDDVVYPVGARLKVSDGEKVVVQSKIAKKELKGLYPGDVWALDLRHMRPAIPAQTVAKPATTALARADVDSKSKRDVRDNTDYSAELPRIPPKTPAEALKSFRIHPGLRIELAAAEPMLASPVALDFDEDGRLYIAEFMDFNQHASKTPQGPGRVRLLDDTDGDGAFDKSTVFLTDLHSPVAVCCYNGGVFVGAPPDILYAKDTDGDGTADVRRTVFTGFGYDPGGEALLNSFRWSFDNRIHVATSNSGGQVRHVGNKDAKPVSVRGQGFVIDPRTDEFELTSGGGQHGMSMDDWGRKFTCTSHDPAFLIMYDGRYLARNPYVEAPGAAARIAPGGYTTKVRKISPNEPWRILRTKWRTTGIEDPHPTEGAEPSGYFSAASGVTIYRGDALPAQFYGNLFVGEVANNLIYCARLEPNGLSLTARRADEDAEFLASTDAWFRPVQFANGPDGALYVLDMYRGLVEAADFMPPEIVKHMDVSDGFDKGRLYRIVPEGFKRSKVPSLSRASTSELVALLEHPNAWHRDTASRLLYERQDTAAVAPLKKLANESDSPLGRMHSLYALAGLKALDAPTVIHALRDADARVRVHAVRLAEAFESSSEVRARLEKLTDDADLQVRYQLAYSLGTVKGELPTRALAKLARHDGGDSWFRLAILSSVNGRAADIFKSLVSEKDYRGSQDGRTLLLALAGVIGGTNRSDEVATFAESVSALPDNERVLVRDLGQALIAKLPRAGRAALASGKIGNLLDELVRNAKQTAADERTSVKERVAAVRLLDLAAFAEQRDLFRELLKARQPQPVQSAAVETLAGINQPGVPELLLEAWPSLSPQMRASAIEALFSRPAWVSTFLDAVDQGKLNRADIDPARIQALATHADARLRTRVAKLFAQTMLASRKDVVAAYQKALELKGNHDRGRAVFKKQCVACHQLEGEGTQIGADLSAIRDKGTEAILLNILDPNREVKPQFHSYVTVTDDGRTITGMIRAENANSLTIQRADGTMETVLRIHIDDLQSTGLSFMPEGLEKQIDVPAMADLLAYLNSIK